jgi:hypothetical protein
MGLELHTEPDPIRVESGFVLVGEKWPIAINPETVSHMEPSPVRDSSGTMAAIVIHLVGAANPIRLHVVRFADLLRAMESAIQWRRTWPA